MMRPPRRKNFYAQRRLDRRMYKDKLRVVARVVADYMGKLFFKTELRESIKLTGKKNE